MSAASVVVVFHARESLARVPYYRSTYLLPFWRARGIDVRFLWGIGASPAAGTIVLPQVDLTVLPADYARWLDGRPAVLNRACASTRKTVVSRHLVARDDAWDGPVIVKTDLNYAGDPELRLLAGHSHRRRVLGRWVHRLLVRLWPASLARVTTLDPNGYPIFPSRHAVPPGAFTNPALVVERFLPERDARGLYVVRSVFFLGDRSVTIRSLARSPIVKGATLVATERAEPAPEVDRTRRALGLDYGKIDYVVHDGEAAVLDVNLTPTFGEYYAPELRRTMAAEVERGIDAWLPGSPRTAALPAH